MAKSPLILAALAKAAVPAVNYSQVRPLGSPDSGSFESALLQATTGEHYVIKMARTSIAQLEQLSEMVALKAIGPADRLRLPFAMPRLEGETKDEAGNSAWVLDFIYGEPVFIESISAEDNMVRSIAEAVAAIHVLPLNVVRDADLPEIAAAEQIRGKVVELDRAAATGKVPPRLLSRWEAALEDVALFRYQPTVIHGALRSARVLQQEGAVTGVLGWHALRISDPAEDLAWIFGTGNTALCERFLAAYIMRRSAADLNLRQRATLYAELELARLLAQAISQHDEVGMAHSESALELLSEDLQQGKLLALSASPLSFNAG